MASSMARTLPVAQAARGLAVAASRASGAKAFALITSSSGRAAALPQHSAATASLRLAASKRASVCSQARRTGIVCQAAAGAPAEAKGSAGGLDLKLATYFILWCAAATTRRPSRRRRDTVTEVLISKHFCISPRCSLPCPPGVNPIQVRLQHRLQPAGELPMLGLKLVERGKRHIWSARFLMWRRGGGYSGGGDGVLDGSVQFLDGRAK